MSGKYKCEYNPLGGVILDENDEYVPISEIVKCLNEQGEDIQEFVKLLNPVNALLEKYGFSSDDLYRLVESGIDAEIGEYKKLLRIAERIIKVHLSEAHNQEYQRMKLKVLFSGIKPVWVRGRCYMGVVDGVESEKVE